MFDDLEVCHLDRGRVQNSPAASCSFDAESEVPADPSGQSRRAFSPPPEGWLVQLGRGDTMIRRRGCRAIISLQEDEKGETKICKHPKDQDND